MSSYIDKHGNTVVLGGSVPKKNEIGNKKTTTIQQNTKTKFINDIANGTIELPIVGTEISNMIRNKRNELGLTQKDLAKTCSLPLDIINDYEKGTAITNVSTLNKLKKGLGITKFPQIIKKTAEKL